MKLTSAVGNTPMVSLGAFAHARGVPATVHVLAKLESCNPSSSVKDRAAEGIINDAEATGRLTPGATVVEASSGNTAVALAMICAQRGYKFIAVMPNTMSLERRAMIMVYGGKVVLTPGAQGMPGAVRVAQEIADLTHGIVAGQFTNPANPRAHYETTGPEIYSLVGKKPIAGFISAVGTGGTVTGTGRYLKEVCPDIRVIAVEPEESRVLAGGAKGPHGIQGIGAGFVPEVFDRKVVTDYAAVNTQDALAASRELGRLGYAVGISAGANALAATRWAAEHGKDGDIFVTVLCDTGERYLSASLFTGIMEEAKNLPTVENGADAAI